MENNISNFIQDLSWAHLRQADRTMLTPFQLVLADNPTPLICKEIVRILPGKRAVAFGTWGDKAVVAKLFYEPRHAARHAKRDAAGIKALHDNGVLTPPLHYQDTTPDQRVHILIFERIMGADDLDTLWQERLSIKDSIPLLHAVTIELATHHVLGVLQHDLHFKNFLVKASHIYTLDGGDVEIFNGPLSKKQSLDNLGLFFSQLGVGTEELQQLLFQIYTRSRGWLVKKHDIQYLHAAVKKWTAMRWEQYQKKIFRTCTDFIRQDSTKGVTVYDRHYQSAELIEFLNHPEAAFTAKDTVILKAGNSATVAKIRLADRFFVVKRYNLKNTWHRLRRCLRTSRAATGWTLAQRLRLLSIPTAKPIAFIENRFLGLRGKSYLLMEYVEGVHAGEYFSTSSKETDNSLFTVHQIIALFENLAKLHITHGDLKMTNVLIAKQKPVLIDLDGMQEHRRFPGFKRAFRKEMRRFMENWRHVPTIYTLFEQLLAEMYKRLGIKKS